MTVTIERAEQLVGAVLKGRLTNIITKYGDKAESVSVMLMCEKIDGNKISQTAVNIVLPGHTERDGDKTFLVTDAFRETILWKVKNPPGHKPSYNRPTLMDIQVTGARFHKELNDGKPMYEVEGIVVGHFTFKHRVETKTNRVAPKVKTKKIIPHPVRVKKVVSKKVVATTPTASKYKIVPMGSDSGELGGVYDHINPDLAIISLDEREEYAEMERQKEREMSEVGAASY